MWIGIDDTDGPDGGCTTHVLTEVVRIAGTLGIDLLGLPRLVRLDPNIPWKTRGNGALAARFGHGLGTPAKVGEIGGVSIRSYSRGRPPTREESEALSTSAWAVVRSAAGGSDSSDPAMVTAPRALAGALYRRAVAEPVAIAMARRAVRAAGGSVRVARGARGIVGAASAISWPGRRRTYELLAYRAPGRVGRPREIERSSVEAASRRFPSLFACIDDRTRRLLIAPHTACPILFGLRGRRIGDLAKAARLVSSERVDRWLLFATNQATGDHWVPRGSGRWPPYGSGVIRGVVEGPPETIRGGHVRFEVVPPGGEPVPCIAFEPTKLLPKAARSLRSGDRVEIAGGRGATGPIRIEQLTIRSRAVHLLPPAPPDCPDCSRPTRSRGADRGFRCPRCHRRFPPEAAVRRTAPPEVPLGVYDPTPSARRHLHPYSRGAR